MVFYYAGRPIDIGILNIVFSFTYNKIYTNNLVAKGYKPADETSKLFMLNAGIRF